MSDGHCEMFAHGGQLCSVQCASCAVDAENMARRDAVTLALAARDAGWRAAVEAVRQQHGPDACWVCHAGMACFSEWSAKAHNAALDAVLTKMEGR